MRTFALAGILTTIVFAIGCSKSGPEQPSARAFGERLRVKLDAQQSRDGTAVPTSSATSPVSPAPAASATANATADVASASGPGLVQIELIAPAGFPSVNESSGPWLYVDGRLTRDYSAQSLDTIITDTLPLKPGNYLIEAVAAGMSRGGVDVPLTVLRTRVRVENNVSVAFKQEFPLLDATSIPKQGPWQTPPDDFRDWARSRQTRAEQQMRRYQFDALAAAIKRLDKTLASQPGSATTQGALVTQASSGQTVAWLEIPDSFGGRREVNAAQIRLLVDWIKNYYWSDWPAKFTDHLRAPNELPPPELQGQLHELELIDGQVRKHWQEIDRLKAAADKLEGGR